MTRTKNYRTKREIKRRERKRWTIVHSIDELFEQINSAEITRQEIFLRQRLKFFTKNTVHGLKQISLSLLLKKRRKISLDEEEDKYSSEWNCV